MPGTDRIQLPRFWIIMAAAAFAAAPAIAGGPLKLYTENLPPFNYLAPDQTTVVGAGTEVVIGAMARAQVKYRLELTGWARAYHFAKTEPQSCVFVTARTPEREELFRWIGPIIRHSWRLWAPNERARKLHSLEEVRTATIGNYRANAQAEYLQNRGFNVVTSVDHETTLRNLLLGRIDYWAASDAVARHVLKEAGVADKVQPVLTFYQTELYLACNPGVPPETTVALQQAIDQMRSDRTLERILHKYEVN